MLGKEQFEVVSCAVTPECSVIRLFSLLWFLFITFSFTAAGLLCSLFWLCCEKFMKVCWHSLFDQAYTGPTETSNTVFRQNLTFLGLNL